MLLDRTAVAFRAHVDLACPLRSKLLARAPVGRPTGIFVPRLAVRTSASMTPSQRDSTIWVPEGPTESISGAATGPLKGLTFAAKDLYDVKGYITGFGQPSWRKAHPAASSTAPAVQALLDAGATLVGTTQMDELAYSLEGQNVHYGTPRNPACPNRIPGGSSSGSAVAVADGSVDFAMGSDTGGSVRVPASFCGVLGLRPTWGRVSLAGACTLAETFDTGGFFAREASVLRAVGDVLLDQSTRSAGVLKRWLVGTDAFDLAESDSKQALYQAVQRDLHGVKSVLGEPQEVTVATIPGGENLVDWMNCFRVTQGREVWEALGEWVTEAKPDLGPGTKQRFEMASKLQPDEVRKAKQTREAVIQHMGELLGNDAVLMVPSAPGPAPVLNLPQNELNTYRKQLISLTSIAGLAKLPQVSLPVAVVNGCPVGLGLIGPQGSDEELLRLTKELLPLLKGSAS